MQWYFIQDVSIGSKVRVRVDPGLPSDEQDTQDDTKDNNNDEKGDKNTKKQAQKRE